MGIVAGSLVLGGLTSVAQGPLPDSLRGLSYSPLFWGAVGLVAGPVVGWSTAVALARTPLLSVAMLLGLTLIWIALGTADYSVLNEVKGG